MVARVRDLLFLRTDLLLKTAPVGPGPAPATNLGVSAGRELEVVVVKNGMAVSDLPVGRDSDSMVPGLEVLVPATAPPASVSPPLGGTAGAGIVASAAATATVGRLPVGVGAPASASASTT